MLQISRQKTALFDPAFQGESGEGVGVTRLAFEVHLFLISKSGLAQLAFLISAGTHSLGIR